jgi:glycosyltransferase involved in cell wall biosynthesis
LEDDLVISEQKMLLFISALDFWSMGKGKGGPALWRTLTGYAQRGWKVFFITGNRAQGAPPDLPENIHVIRFDAPWLKRLTQIRKLGFFFKVVWWLWFQWMSFIKARKLHAKHKFDVVYGYEIYGVPVAKVLSRIWHAPMVSRFQGTSFGAGWVNKRFRKIRAWEHLIGLRLPADLVIMTNDGTQGDKVLRELGADMNRVKFWMNGVDWQPFETSLEQQEARKQLSMIAEYVLLTVSRLESWKHVERSIKALPDAVKYFMDTVLVVVGDGSERDRLEGIARELGVEQHVRFEGGIPHDEVPKYLAAADIFLSLYDWSNVGNPLLEAMMAGKCIVTLNNGDTSQFITDKENGILLEYDELTKLPEVIRDLLADKEQRQRLGANAREFAEDNFWTWEERMDAEVNEVTVLVEKRGEPVH